MHRRLVPAALVALVSLTHATAADWRDGVFPVQKHDFGTVAVAADTEYVFPVVNTFSSPLHLRDIRASCGCTTPTILTETLQPGESGSIRAKFNTDTFRGKKGATLTVVMDRPFYSEIRLRVDGYIRSDMVFHPGSVDFGAIPAGSEAEKTVKILYAGRSDWDVVDVSGPHEWLTATANQTERQSGRVTYELTVRVEPDAPVGFFQREVVVTTNDRKMPRVPLKVTGRVESSINVSPSVLAAGTVRKGEPIEKRLVVMAKKPGAIDWIRADGWDIRCDAGETPSRSHVLPLTMTYVGETTGSLKTELTVCVDGCTASVPLSASIE